MSAVLEREALGCAAGLGEIAFAISLRDCFAGGGVGAFDSAAGFSCCCDDGCGAASGGLAPGDDGADDDGVAEDAGAGVDGGVDCVVVCAAGVAGEF